MSWLLPENQDPLSLFDRWYQEAQACREIKDASAMNLATATRSGKPSNRIVLLKEYDASGFVFYTNLESQKGQELKDNPQASLCFYWAPLDKQIRIAGRACLVSPKTADQYFNSRPLKSRIGAVISKQSRPLSSHSHLIQEVAQFSLKKGNRQVTRPPYWSGYKILPDEIEFWSNGLFRLHTRYRFQRNQNTWKHTLLYP